MNRREFLKLAGIGALGMAGAMLPARTRAWEPIRDGDWQHEVYLPIIGATKPRPTPWITLTPTPDPTPMPQPTPTPAYEPLAKGAVIIRAVSDVATLGASWWYSYTLGPTQYLNDQHVPMLRDPGIYRSGVWEWMLTQPRIERACWFPARWAESWTDPGGVGWVDQRLLDDAGALTSVGSVYAGLGG